MLDTFGASGANHWVRHPGSCLDSGTLKPGDQQDVPGGGIHLGHILSAMGAGVHDTGASGCWGAEHGQDILTPQGAQPGSPDPGESTARSSQPWGEAQSGHLYPWGSTARTS